MGGNYAFQLGCTSRRVAAVVDFYGRLVHPDLSREKPIQPLELALNLSCPVLFHFGAEDASIPAEHVLGLETVLAQFANSGEIETWAGAGHGFFNDRRPGYHGPSARAAWDRTLLFLRAELD
jgi:carboxymethylenebutenolidase